MTAENTRSKARGNGGPTPPALDPQSANQERQRHEKRAALVGGRVLQALGEPGELLKVQARPLWEGAYRVNVFVGANIACATIAHSYFVVTDGDGEILQTNPAIKRSY